MTLKIFVTGATGFLGKAIALHLKDLGHSVTAQGRNPALCEELRQQGFEVIQASDDDHEIIKRACEGKNVVVNCAGLSRAFGKISAFKSANVDLVNTLIAGCLEQNAKFIQISSPSIYANFTDQHQLTENSVLPKIKVNDYAESKYLADTNIAKAQKERGLRAIILRPHLVYGPGDHKILSRLIEAHATGPLPLFGENKKVDLTYIDNFTAAVLLAIENDGATGKIFNITNGEPQPIINLLIELFKQLDVPLRTRLIPSFISFELLSIPLMFIEKCCKYLQYVGYDPNPFYTKYSLSIFAKDFTLDNFQAKQVLGYQPKITINEGLANFAKWYKYEQEKKQEREKKNKKTSPRNKSLLLGAGFVLGAGYLTYSIFSRSPISEETVNLLNTKNKPNF